VRPCLKKRERGGGKGGRDEGRKGGGKEEMKELFNSHYFF
jgi:hypothetical protein